MYPVTLSKERSDDRIEIFFSHETSEQPLEPPLGELEPPTYQLQDSSPLTLRPTDVDHLHVKKQEHTHDVSRP